MLAIVIPYYKAPFFEELLESLAKQTNQNFNVYVGDDASPENPEQILKKYEELLKLQYKRFDNNLGNRFLASHWKRCIKMIGDEEWIMILGDDDLLEPEVVSDFYRHFSSFKGKSKVVRFSSKIIYDEENRISELFRQPKWEDPATAFFRRFKGETRSSLSEYIFEKSSYRKIGFQNFPLAWHSDDCAWLEFAENQPIYGINDSAVLIRISEYNISGKEDNLEEKRKAKKAFYKYIISQKLSHFSLDQRKYLLEAFENTIRKKRNLNLKEWALLIKQYFNFTDANIQKKFFKRQLKRILNR